MITKSAAAGAISVVIAFGFAGESAYAAGLDPLDPLIGYWAGSGTVRAKPGAPAQNVTCRANYKYTSDARSKLKASVTCDNAKTKSTFVAFIAPDNGGGLRGSWWQSQGEQSGELGGDLKGNVAGDTARFSVDAAGKTRGEADISIGAQSHQFVVRAIDDASQSLNITFRR